MFILTGVDTSISSVSEFNTVIELLTNFVTLGGGLWLVWGVVILGTALKDKNGPALQSGLWQVVGGGLIIVAANVFGTFIK